MSKILSSTKNSIVLIDGDHSYNMVKCDFELVWDDSNIIVLHDIVSDACPGVVSFFRELEDSEEFYTKRFDEQYSSVNGSYLGIGIVESKKLR